MPRSLLAARDAANRNPPPPRGPRTGSPFRGDLTVQTERAKGVIREATSRLAETRREAVACPNRARYLLRDRAKIAGNSVTGIVIGLWLSSA